MLLHSEGSEKDEASVVSAVSSDGMLASMKRGATFSRDRRYRYALSRIWDAEGQYAMFVCLNPSTADEANDDPTVRRCIAFSQLWGYSGMRMANLFALRATDPQDLSWQCEPVGPRNDQFLRGLAQTAGIVIAAWGNHGAYIGRGAAVRESLPKLHYLRFTKSGHPSHPLYLPRTLQPKTWD